MFPLDQDSNLLNRYEPDDKDRGDVGDGQRIFIAGKTFDTRNRFKQILKSLLINANVGIEGGKRGVGRMRNKTPSYRPSFVPSARFMLASWEGLKGNRRSTVEAS